MRNELFEAYGQSIGDKEATGFKKRLSKMTDSQKQTLEHQLKGMFHEIRNIHGVKEQDDLFESTVQNNGTFQTGGEFDPTDLFTPIVDGSPVTYEGLIPIDQTAHVIRTEDNRPTQASPKRRSTSSGTNRPRSTQSSPQSPNTAPTVPQEASTQDIANYYRNLRKAPQSNSVGISPQNRGIDSTILRPAVGNLTSNDVQAYKEVDGETIFRKDGNDFTVDSDGTVRRYLPIQNDSFVPNQVESTNVQRNLLNPQGLTEFQPNAQINPSNVGSASRFHTNNYGTGSYTIPSRGNDNITQPPVQINPQYNRAGNDYNIDPISGQGVLRSAAEFTRSLYPAYQGYRNNPEQVNISENVNNGYVNPLEGVGIVGEITPITSDRTIIRDETGNTFKFNPDTQKYKSYNESNTQVPSFPSRIRTPKFTR